MDLIIIKNNNDSRMTQAMAKVLDSLSLRFQTKTTSTPTNPHWASVAEYGPFSACDPNLRSRQRTIRWRDERQMGKYLGREGLETGRGGAGWGRSVSNNGFFKVEEVQVDD